MSDFLAELFDRRVDHNPIIHRKGTNLRSYALNPAEKLTGERRESGHEIKLKTAFLRMEIRISPQDNRRNPSVHALNQGA
jgi:hypothetical protein